MSIELSVVVPIFNEEQSLPYLHKEIVAALDGMGLGPERSEILYVDDRSTDSSLKVMLELRAEDSRVRVVHFRRNFGQTAAMAAGFDESRGRIVVTMDGDLQNDPADIPRLVAELENGYDVVAGWRKQRHDGFVLRRLPSILANRLIATVTGVSIPRHGLYAEGLPPRAGGEPAHLRGAAPLPAGPVRRLGRPRLGARRQPPAAALRQEQVRARPRDTRAARPDRHQMIAQFSHRPLQYFGLVAFGAFVLGGLFGLAGLLGVTGADRSWSATRTAASWP